MILSAHSTKETKIFGLPNFAPYSARSASVTPRAREQAPHALIGIFLVTSLPRTSASGGEPTGTTALATDFRIRETASPRRKICTTWPASESASPSRKGNAAFVGSSDPHALFMRIFSFVGLALAAGTAAAAAKSGQAASFLRNDRRIIGLKLFYLDLMAVGAG